MLIRLALLLSLALLVPACGGSGPLPGAPADTIPPGASKIEVLVEPHDPADLDDIARETGATVLGPVPGTPFYRLRLPPGETLEHFLHELGDDVRVADADEDVGLTSPEGKGSTVPFLGSELPLTVLAQPEVTRMGAAAAQARTRGAGVRVAVVDTGVIATHPLLAGHVDPDGFDLLDGDPDPAEEANGIDDDGDGRVDEGYGHGTFVASLVLAVAPDARIVCFRALNSDAVGTASALAEAVTRAADAGVDVINLSAGMEQEVRVVLEAVKSARHRGVLVVSAAGNTGLEDVVFPAATSDAESVTSVDDLDHRAPFASFGGEVDLSAPGVDLLGAFPSPSGTAHWSGTSFSAALVSGAFALVRSRFPTLNAQDVLKQLEDTAVDVDPVNPGFSGRLGRGRIDLDAATR